MAVELASAYVSLIPSFKGGGAAIAKEMSAPAQAAGRDVGKKMGGEVSSGLTGSLKGIGAAIGGTVIASKAFDFLGGAVDQASSLNETVSKSRAVFGPASADLERWAKGAATTMGLSRQQALDLAGTFGNMFTQLGIGTDKAAGMSKQMGGLAADLASFHDADITDVIAAQSAAFRGEYDGLQRFIPTINAAAVEQEALRETGKKAAKDLTATDKALATQTLMLKGAGKATGDFARTADGLANKQRTQAAQMDNLRATIGSGLLPIVSKATSAFIALGTFVEKNKAVIGPLAAVIGGALTAAFASWAAGAIAAAIPTIAAAAPVLLLGAAVAGLAILVVKNWDTIKGAVSTAVGFVKGLVMGLIDTFKKVPGWIETAFSTVAKIITAPYKAAFNLIAKAWNNTIGKLHFKLPSIHLGPFKTPGFTIDVPDIPTFHDGGIVGPGLPRGREVLTRLQAGETVLPIGASPGGVQVVQHINGNDLDAQTIAELVARKASYQLRTLTA